MKPGQPLLLAALCLFAPAAWAAPKCYSPEELRAEQWLRLHSELMVVAVTCRQDSYGYSLSDDYAAFTRKNIRTLHAAENTMISYYQTTAKRDAIERLDRLRTRLGNETAQKAARLSAPKFCETYRDEIAFFKAASPRTLEDQIQNRAALGKSFAKSCESAAQTKKGR